MLTYEYTAKDPATGKEVKSEVTAESESAAAKLISQQGFAPVDIQLKGKKRGIKFGGRITAKDKVLFSRQLATLINAGLPLTQSLRTVTEQMSNKDFVIIINKIIGDVEGGSAFNKALSKHPAIFNEVFLSLVAAGEVSGTLDEALERIANQQEKDAEIVSKVRGALVYPILVLVVMVAVIAFLMVTVLPQVELLYDDLGQSLPWVTAIMLNTSALLTKFWYLFLILLVISVWGLRQWSKTEGGRSFFDMFKMRMPLFGRLFMKMYMARFTRTGQTLMSTGVPMLEMMRISANAVNNVHIKESIMQATTKVKAGATLSDSIKDSPNFLSLVPQMIGIGEQSGAIDSMMGKAATFYENELDNEIKAISTIIEPALMVVIAFIAGIAVVAILLPIYGLVGSNIGF